MTITTTETLFNTAAKYAVSATKVDDVLQPRIIFFKNNVPVSYIDLRHDDDQYIKVGKLISAFTLIEKDYDAYISIQEAYTSTYTREEFENNNIAMPRDDPKADSIILLNGCVNDQTYCLKRTTQQDDGQWNFEWADVVPQDDNTYNHYEKSHFTYMDRNPKFLHGITYMRDGFRLMMDGLLTDYEEPVHN